MVDNDVCERNATEEYVTSCAVSGVLSIDRSETISRVAG